jgi:hypothetical protein
MSWLPQKEKAKADPESGASGANGIVAIEVSLIDAFQDRDVLVIVAAEARRPRQSLKVVRLERRFAVGSG